jgi:hypothetical protein
MLFRLYPEWPGNAGNDREIMCSVGGIYLNKIINNNFFFSIYKWKKSAKLYTKKKVLNPLDKS